jgi:ABC-2 type transport system ATP-binding protein
MSMIEVANVTKTFRVPKHRSGFLGGLRTLLSREYDEKHAVAGLDFRVEEGELLGYLGPNGAGKSTTIKLLTGILVPTSGTVHVAGREPWRHREQNALAIGAVFGQRSQLWWDLPLIESFKLIGKMYRVDDATYRCNLARFTDMLDMDAFITTPVRQLSLGQRMRGDLAAAMLYEPRILYLDEPTIGLDVLAQERIRLFIEEINRDQRTTILLTTHDLRDVERLCRRILLIDHGRVIYDGAVAPLKRRYIPHRILQVQLAGTPPPDAPALDGAHDVRYDDGRVVIEFDPATTPLPHLIAQVTAHYAVTDLHITEPDLEQVIRQMYTTRGAQA